MNITPHFTLAELTASETARKCGIDNKLPDKLLPNLRVLAEGMEQIRALLGHPIRINSGYRSEALNVTVGGAPTSQHRYGWAADFTCPGFGTPLQVVREIVGSDIKFDQVIAEGSWIHCSFHPRMRQQTLTARFDAAGKATYTTGVSA